MTEVINKYLDTSQFHTLRFGIEALRKSYREFCRERIEELF